MEGEVSRQAIDDNHSPERIDPSPQHLLDTRSGPRIGNGVVPLVVD
jgi:hypothetical protein